MRTVLCLILGLSFVTPLWGKFTVRSVEGRVELTRRGQAPLILQRGHSIDVTRGTFSVAKKGLVRLSLPGGGVMALAGGSALQFVRGGMWLRLKTGALLVDIRDRFSKRLRFAFEKGFVTPKGPGSFSMVFKGSQKLLGLFVFSGTVRVVSRSVEHLIEAGRKAAWIGDQLSTKGFAMRSLVDWWEHRGALVPLPPVPESPPLDGPVAGITSVQSRPLRPETSLNLLPAPLAGLESGGGSPGVSGKGNYFTWLLWGLLAVSIGLAATFVSQGAVLWRLKRGQRSGIFSSVMDTFGLAPFCPRCNARMHDGVITSIPVAHDLQKYKYILMHYVTPATWRQLWPEIEAEVQARRLLERNGERIVVSYRRCSKCPQQSFRLTVGRKFLGEYDSKGAGGEVRYAERLQTFLVD